MKILLLWPPHIPSYFNAGHHLPLFQVAQYIRKNKTGIEVVAIDAGVLNYNWKEIADILSREQFDFIGIMNDFDAIDGFSRIVRYIRVLSEKSKIITFGRLSKQIPDFFTNYDIDAIATDGDYEISIIEFIKYLEDSQYLPKGVMYKNDIATWVQGCEGYYLDATKWEFPDLSEIPYLAYDKLYENDQNRFCGIPNRRELVVNVSRGCPVGCSFCDVPIMQGKKDRRLAPDVLVEYIEDTFNKYPFEYVSFYSPTFTLNRNWTLKFCKLLTEKEKKYSWKCVTTVQHLDQELLKAMKESGCIRVSIGVETLSELDLETLPKIKQSNKDKIIAIMESCNVLDIELNCFVMLGIPGDSVEEINRTIDFLNGYNVRVRPTIFTPYNLLKADMSTEEVSMFNRQLFTDNFIEKEDEKELYKIFFNKNYRMTEVYENIDKRK